MGKIEIKQGMNCKATQGMEGHYIFAKTVTRTHLEAALLSLLTRETKSGDQSGMSLNSIFVAHRSSEISRLSDHNGLGISDSCSLGVSCSEADFS